MTNRHDSSRSAAHFFFGQRTAAAMDDKRVLGQAFREISSGRERKAGFRAAVAFNPAWELQPEPERDAFLSSEYVKIIKPKGKEVNKLLLSTAGV